MRHLTSVLKKWLIVLFCVEMCLSFNVVSFGSSDNKISKYKNSVTKTKSKFPTSLGGNSEDRGSSIVIDKEGNQYFAGSTNSLDWGSISSSIGRYYGGTDAFVAKINTNK